MTLNQAADCFFSRLLVHIKTQYQFIFSGGLIMPTQSYETELYNLGKLTKELRELFKLLQTGKYQKTKLNVLFCTKQCVSA